MTLTAPRATCLTRVSASASEAWRGLHKAGNAKTTALPVRAVDLSRIIHAVHRSLRGDGRRDSTSTSTASSSSIPASSSRIVMKLDVEGLEFAVLPALIRAQALCLIDGIRIEWHTRFWGGRVAVAAAAARNLTAGEVGAKAIVGLTEAIRSQVRLLLPREQLQRSMGGGADAGPYTGRGGMVRGGGGGGDCRTRLLEADDETYIHDRKPWPAHKICNRTGLS